MADELQDVVDRLAADLGAAVLVEDARQQPVGYSAQHGPVDRMRSDSILRRATSPDVVDWFERYRIVDAREPLWIAGSDDAGVLGRICCPVRHDGELLGFVWVIDADGQLFAHQLERVTTGASRLAVLLRDRQRAERLPGDLVGGLLSPTSDRRAASAQTLVTHGWWPRGCGVCAVVASLSPDTASDQDGYAFADVVGRLLATAVDRDVLTDVRTDHAVLLVPARSDDDPRPATLAGTLVDAVTEELGVRVVAGIGDTKDDLRDAATSYEQALVAARVSPARADGDRWPRWRDLGVLRVLAQLSSWRLDDVDLDPRVRRLLEAADTDVLRTAEAYLDNAGDAQRTAAQLHLHRGTLYYRLDKVAKLCGLQLRDCGADRLSLHVGLKLARLDGRYQG